MKKWSRCVMKNKQLLTTIYEFVLLFLAIIFFFYFLIIIIWSLSCRLHQIQTRALFNGSLSTVDTSRQIYEEFQTIYAWHMNSITKQEYISAKCLLKTRWRYCVGINKLSENDNKTARIFSAFRISIVVIWGTL